jgi:uncharacterized damage-inducible protein DinB
MPRQSPFDQETLIAEMEQTRQSLLAAVACLSPAQRVQVFLGTWSVKELLAHLAGWDDANLEAAQAVMAGRLPAFYAYKDRDWQTFNARLVAERRREDFSGLLALVETTHQKLVEFLRALPAEAFDKDYGVRYKGYRVTIARLLRSEMGDESTHRAQVETFAARDALA